MGSGFVSDSIVIGKSVDGFLAWQAAVWGCALWLLFVIVRHFSTWGKLKDWYGGLVLLGVIELVIGQYTGVCPVYRDSFPVTGTFENPAGLAACLAVCFPAALYFSVLRSIGWKVWGGLAVGLIGVAGVISGARTGIVAVGSLTVAAVCRFFLHDSRLVAWMKMTLVLVGVLIIFGLYFWKKNSADGRLLVWNCSLAM